MARGYNTGIYTIMRLTSHLIYTSFILTTLFLSGCSSTPKPPIAQISFNVKPNINLSTDGISNPEPRPVVIRLYELKSTAAFNSADFFGIFNQYKDTLDNELVNSEEFQLFPGKKVKFNRTLHLDTRYVGVVSAFRDLEHAQWRAVTKLPPDETNLEIYLLLDKNDVLIGAKPECSFFCRLWSPTPPVGTLYEIIEQTEE